MSKKTYTGKDIDVSFDKDACIHAAECVRGLPAVFDVDKRPWIQPDNGAADAIRDVVARCPSGALEIVMDEAANESAPAPGVQMRIKSNGPVLVTGPCEIEGPDGNPVVIDKPTFALCRCGLSEKKPFCDGTHAREGWSAGD